jgi:hypothetical protein
MAGDGLLVLDNNGDGMITQGAYAESSKVDAAGNAHKQEATFVRKVGKNYSSSAIVDVWFKFTGKK